MSVWRIGFLGAVLCVLCFFTGLTLNLCAEKVDLSRTEFQNGPSFFDFSNASDLSSPHDSAERQTQNFEQHSRDEMLTDAVVYLQKSITALKRERNSHSLNRRITPILTVLSGLLDAGFTRNDPIVLSSVEFLETFYTDFKEQRKGEKLSADERHLLAKIRKCLKKAQNSQPQTRAAKPLHEKQPFFQAQRSQSQQKFVISPGLSGFARLRDESQPSFKSLEKSELKVAHWSDFQYKILIASVHALDEYFPVIPIPQSPDDSDSFFVPQFAVRSNDDRDLRTIISFYLHLAYSETLQTDDFDFFETENLRSTALLSDLRTTRRRE